MEKKQFTLRGFGLSPHVFLITSNIYNIIYNVYIHKLHRYQLQVPTEANFNIQDVLSYPSLFDDPWNDAGMGQLLTYLAGSSRATHFPEAVKAIVDLVPWSEFRDAVGS